MDTENLVLPPLRTFPESYSRDTTLPSLRDVRSHGQPGPSASRSYLAPNFSDSASEVSSPCYAHSFMDRDTYSRDSSPSEESLDMDTDLEGSQDQYPLQMIMFDSPGQKGKKGTVSGNPKPKKVKYHFCEICQKPFPRPSGLRAHMNMHTKEKPYECGFPGCSKRFSVSSNAKRHLRTHGVGLSPSDEPSPLPYVVDFEEPMVVATDSDDTVGSAPEPMSLRWMPPGAGSRRSNRSQPRTDPV